MARKNDDPAIRTLKRIGDLKRRLSESRSRGASLRLRDSLEFELVWQALDLLSSTIQAPILLAEGQHNNGTLDAGEGGSE